MHWERYFVYLYRVSLNVDPVVLIWTATFGIFLAYFLLSKLVNSIFHSSSSRGGAAGEANERRQANAQERGQPQAPGREAQAAAKRGHLADVSKVVVRPEIRERFERIQKRLGGARRVTLSTCGLIFTEADCDKLRRSATLLPDAKDMVEALTAFADVYLVTQVLDDASTKNVTEAFRESGICPGMIKPHKVLFCEKHVSKVSIARQIEPDYHIDKDNSVNIELSRFKIKCLTELD
jgi:5'(3')-deoxyribonucleotidase